MCIRRFSSIHFDKLGLVEGNKISYGNDLKISIDDIKQGYKKWLKESNKSVEVITKSSLTGNSADKNIIDVTTENMSAESMTLILNLLVKILFEDFNIWNSSEKYTESLFNLKLSLFELDFVKKSNNRILKSQMRKSKTPLELMNSVIGIYNEIHNGSSNAKSNKKVSKQSS